VNVYNESGSCRGSATSGGSSLLMGAEAITADHLAQEKDL
jgi:hypothetical protein